jgi:hypothetical protein
MTAKDQVKNKDVSGKNDNNQPIYRNNGELADKNGYMVYELNNTFEDKDKDILELTSNTNVNYKSVSQNNTNYKSENRLR